ncbi:MAG: alpha/beta hydrolase [Armatimonadetes bacterium]|nr:alpha/beta hydrolase [Armatimonadota bacterium]
MTFTELFNADVRIQRDIPYLAGSGDPRHLLDVYAPPDANGLPVVIYFYGGGWRSGDKRLFEHLGRAFAVRGIVAVTVNYRLTPAVQHPSHADDCAQAVRWVHQRIAEFGGDPNSLFLMGHSAGAHLAAFVALNADVQARNQFPAGAVRGVVAISGVYNLNTHAESPGFTSLELIHEAFGGSAEALQVASPVHHISDSHPPFLVMVAESDPERMRDGGKQFANALREAGNDARFVSIRGRDHFSIVRRFGPTGDTTVEAIVQFIKHWG